MFALPNALTILRIVLVPVFAIAFVMPGEAARLVAFGIFVIALSAPYEQILSNPQ